MPRRSPSPALIIERRCECSLKVPVPPHGLGLVTGEITAWLNTHVGPDRWTKTSATAIGADCIAYHFATVDDLVRFREAFPELPRLINLTTSQPSDLACGSSRPK